MSQVSFSHAVEHTAAGDLNARSSSNSTNSPIATGLLAVAMTAKVDAILQRINVLAVNFCSDPSSSQNLALLEESLTNLIRETPTVDPVGRLNPHNLHLFQFLSVADQLLVFIQSGASIRSKVHLALFNLAHNNVRIRRYLCSELKIVGSVFQCLKQSLREQLGPQNLIDVLRLLQILTYEKCLSIGSWCSELIAFLVGEITRKEEPEWLPYCVAILCNLVCRSKAVGARIMKNSATHQALCKKLVGFLSSDSRTIVVSALVLVGYLDEKVRDAVFAADHLSQTFMCIFNILKSNEGFMTRAIALDLCRRLIVSDSANVSLAPTLATPAKDLACYSFFTRGVQDLAGYLVFLDGRTEETLKIYQFFVTVCQLHQLRSPVCSAILASQPTETRLTTPVLGMLHTAAWSFDEAIEPEIPLVACDLLTYVLKEAVDSGKPIDSFVPVDRLVDLIQLNVKTVIETKSDLVSYQCRRITCGLRLAEAITADEDARRELLDVLNAQLCAHVNESQLISNPVINFMSKPPAQRCATDLPEWSSSGVNIPLKLLKLLASLKDYNKAHKELYWRSLKDERLIPFLAYAVAFGEGPVVLDALTIFTHCTQIQEYRTKLLSDLVASCALTKAKAADPNASADSSFTASGTRKSVDLSANDVAMDCTPSSSNGVTNQAELNELLRRIKENTDGSNPRISQMVEAFEQKIAILEDRERLLSQMVAEKERALAESQRLWAKARTQPATESKEINKFRAVISDFEQKLAEAETEKLALQSEKEVLVKTVAKLQLGQETSKQRIDQLVNEKTQLTEENKKERELQSAVRAKFDEMSIKFDKASNLVFEKDQEIVELREREERVKSELQEYRAKMEAEIAKRDAEIAQLRQDNQKMQELKRMMSTLLQN